MTDPTPSTRDAVAGYLDAYRRRLIAANDSDLAAAVRLMRADPDKEAAELVDYAAEVLDANISFDWDHPHELRDALYLAAGDWFRELSVTRIRKAVRAEDIPALDYVTAPSA